MTAYVFKGNTQKRLNQFWCTVYLDVFLVCADHLLKRQKCRRGDDDGDDDDDGRPMLALIAEDAGDHQRFRVKWCTRALEMVLLQANGASTMARAVWLFA